MLNNILLSVDFSTNTEYLVKQAIELVMITNSPIHLLHVIDENKNYNSEMNNADEKRFNIALNMLKQWKRTIEETVPACKVKIHLGKGSVHNSIIETAKEIDAQLIILGRETKNGFFSYFRSLNPEEISKLTCCPVLRIVNGTNSTKIQHIVVPVRSFIPARKIELLIVFSKMYRSRIHLVALQNKVWARNEKDNVLLDTYRFLTNRITNRIEYRLLKGTNLAKATLKYSNSIGADMIFVNPQVETRLSIFSGRHINDSLTPKSKLKILYVEPYPLKNLVVE